MRRREDEGKEGAAEVEVKLFHALDRALGHGHDHDHGRFWQFSFCAPLLEHAAE